jgi:hypothetical protein
MLISQAAIGCIRFAECYPQQLAPARDQPDWIVIFTAAPPLSQCINGSLLICFKQPTYIFFKQTIRFSRVIFLAYFQHINMGIHVGSRVFK